MNSWNGRESGPVTGHLINKRGKLELILLATARAGAVFFPSGTYPKFWHLLLFFLPGQLQKGLDLS